MLVGVCSTDVVALPWLCRKIVHVATEYKQAFILTYHSFTTPLDLLAMIKKRYYLEYPGDTDPGVFESDVLTPVRLRIFNFLTQWISTGFFDFMDDETLAAQLSDFIKNDMKKDMPNLAQQLQMMYDRQVIVSLEFALVLFIYFLIFFCRHVVRKITKS